MEQTRNNQHKMKDITENKHGGNANSTAAFGAIKDKMTLKQAQVLATIKLLKGATCKDICKRHHVGMNTISGRLTELKAMGKIKVTGRRDGCAVYEINE
jgi:DNA-binding MarR family transcriptional regulator